MVKDNVEVIQAPPVPPKNDFMMDMVKEFGVPLAKQALKKELGINTRDPEVTKKPFGRAIYALRDFWHGVWWTIPALAASLGLVWILLKALAKFFGV